MKQYCFSVQRLVSSYIQAWADDVRLSLGAVAISIRLSRMSADACESVSFANLIILDIISKLSYCLVDAAWWVLQLSFLNAPVSVTLEPITTVLLLPGKKPTWLHASAVKCFKATF